jgi:hypothetical protein
MATQQRIVHDKVRWNIVLSHICERMHPSHGVMNDGGRVGEFRITDEMLVFQDFPADSSEP